MILKFLKNMKGSFKNLKSNRYQCNYFVTDAPNKCKEENVEYWYYFAENCPSKYKFVDFPFW